MVVNQLLLHLLDSAFDPNLCDLFLWRLLISTLLRLLNHFMDRRLRRDGQDNFLLNRRSAQHDDWHLIKRRWNLVILIQLKLLKHHYALFVDNIAALIYQVAASVDMSPIPINEPALSSDYNKVAEVVNFELAHDVLQVVRVI